MLCLLAFDGAGWYLLTLDLPEIVHDVLFIALVFQILITVLLCHWFWSESECNQTEMENISEHSSLLNSNRSIDF